MPILKHAIKKLRVDKRRTEVNKIIRTKAKAAIRAMRANPSEKALKEAYSLVDKAAKKGIYHKSKADRIKSRLSKLVKSTPKKTKKETSKKTK